MASEATWPEIEAQMRELPTWAQCLCAARAAWRELPEVLTLEPRFGSEVLDWIATTRQALKLVQGAGNRKTVSRFYLDLAAELARACATANANQVQQKGPCAASHRAELIFAAAAFAADAARASTPARATPLAIQSLKLSTDGRDLPAELLEDLRALREGEPLGPVWPNGTPPAARLVEERLQQYQSPLFAPCTA